jgi:hypothetical protein
MIDLLFLMTRRVGYRRERTIALGEGRHAAQQ